MNGEHNTVNATQHLKHIEENHAMTKQHPRKFTLILIVLTLMLGVFQSGLTFGLDFEAPY